MAYGQGAYGGGPGVFTNRNADTVGLPDFFRNSITLQPVSANSQEAALYQLKTHLLLAGWSVQGCGDGNSVYDATGDSVSAASFFTFANSWMRLVAPDDLLEFVFQVIVPTASGSPTLRIKTNRFGDGGAFTAGSPGISQTPAAITEEDYLLGGGTDAAPTGAGWWTEASITGNQFIMGAAETVWPYRFWYVCPSSVTNHIGGHLVLDALDLINPDSDDLYAAWLTTDVDVDGMTTAHYSSYVDADATILTYLDGTLARMSATEFNDFSDGIAPHPVTGDWTLLPVALGRDDGVAAPNGIKGGSSMVLRLGNEGYAVAPHHRHIATPNGVIRWTMTGADYALPWPDASQNLIITGAWDVQIGSVIRFSILEDRTPPVISNLTPAPGVIGRQTPIEFDVTDIDPGIKDVIITLTYDTEQDQIVVFADGEFKGQFASATSQRTVIASGFHFQVLPSSGWSRSIDEIFVHAFDADGNQEGVDS